MQPGSNIRCNNGYPITQCDKAFSVSCQAFSKSCFWWSLMVTHTTVLEQTQPLNLVLTFIKSRLMVTGPIAWTLPHLLSCLAHRDSVVTITRLLCWFCILLLHLAHKNCSGPTYPRDVIRFYKLYGTLWFNFRNSALFNKVKTVTLFAMKYFSIVSNKLDAPEKNNLFILCMMKVWKHGIISTQKSWHAMSGGSPRGFI